MKYTADEIEVRIWAIVVLTINTILLFATITLIYSLTFVVQPMGKDMAPIDKVYTKILNDIMLLCVGVLGGVAGRKASSAVANALAGSSFNRLPSCPMNQNQSTFNSAPPIPPKSNPLPNPHEREAL